MTFPKKTPHEEKLVTFDFEPEAAVGTTLTNPAVVVTVVTGPGSVGDLTISTPTVVDQTVQTLIGSGLDGCKYRVSCEVDASNGEHHQIDKVLPVSEKGAVVP